MTQTDGELWAEEVRERLNEWAAWTRGNQLIVGARHVLARMIQKAAGDAPGSQAAPGYDFTLSIEITDKAIARMRLEAQNQISGQKKRHIKAAKRVLMATYLGNKGVNEIATQYDVSEDHVKALLWYAESYVARTIPVVEAELLQRQRSRAIVKNV